VVITEVGLGYKEVAISHGGAWQQNSIFNTTQGFGRTNIEETQRVSRIAVYILYLSLNTKQGGFVQSRLFLLHPLPFGRGCRSFRFSCDDNHGKLFI
jgi:hypothetical protein